MGDTLVCFFSILLLIVGLIGTFLPILPGLILSFLGLLLYKFGTNADLAIEYVWIFGVLTLLSGVFSYLIPSQTNKRYGGTQWGSLGAFLGTILGILFIPIPFGFLIGMFFGVFVGELLHDFQDKEKAINSVKGALVGFLYGTGFNFLIGLAMLFVVIWDMIF